MDRKKRYFNSQAKRYQYRDEESLRKDCKPEHPPLPPNKRNRVFGTPPKELMSLEKARKTDFYKKQIVTITVEGFGKNLDQTHTLEVHKKLSTPVISIFRQIKRLNLSRPQHDRYFLQATSATYGYFPNPDSPHAWGIAIEINHPENESFAPQKDRKKQSWAIPAWVTAIFYVHGFRWGGHRRDYKEPARFEYAPEAIRPPVPMANTVFPFAKNIYHGESPIRNYHRNESGVGGYFPVALQQQALHGGVHLYPDNPKRIQSVRASLPGYVVAARIPRKDSVEEYDAARFAGNHTGFVLLCHPIRLAGEEKKLYSLYMHLRPIDIDGLCSNKEYCWKWVRWLRKLYQQKKGSIIRIDSTEESGREYQLREPCNSEDQTAKVFIDQGWRHKTIKSEQGQGPRFLRKPSFTEAETMIKAFEKGEMIAFTQPFLTVERAEIIGYIESPKDHSVEGDPIHEFRNNLSKELAKKFRSGFLHWELFTVGDDSLLPELLEKAGIHCMEITETGKMDNYISETELDELLKKLGGDQKKVESLRTVANDSELADEEYEEELVRFMNDPSDFQPDSDKTVNQEQVDSFTQSIKVIIEDSTALIPQGDYSGEISFEGTKAEKEEFSFKAGGEEPTELTFSVPVEAEAIVIKSEALNLEWDDYLPTETGEVQKQIAIRWRNALLTHGNEWYDKSQANFIKRTEEEGVCRKPPSIQSMKPLIWWDREHVKTTFHYKSPTDDRTAELDPFGEGKRDSLFGDGEDQLPADPTKTTLRAIHPVTGVWLLERLRQQGETGIREEWNPELPKEEAELLYLGWGVEAEGKNSIDWIPESAAKEQREIPYGRMTHLVAVYLGHFNHPVELTVKSPEGAEIKIIDEQCEAGTIARTIPFTFWGEWELLAKGKRSIFQKGKLPTGLVGIKPEFDTLPPPLRLREDRYRWEIPFLSGCPDRFQGLVTIRYRVVPKERESWSRAKEFRMSSDGIFLIESDNPRAKVAKNFSFLEYYQVRDRAVPFRLTHKLIETIQRFREACGVGVTILKTYSLSGFSAKVQVGRKLRTSMDEIRRKSILDAISKGVDFLQKDRSGKKPTLTSNSQCLGDKRSSQFFYLEVKPDGFLDAEQWTVADFAIPVEVERSSEKDNFTSRYRMNSKKRYYNNLKGTEFGDLPMGTSFSFNEYRQVQQEVKLREKTLRVLNYFSEKIAAKTGNHLKLSQLPMEKEGLELSFKTDQLKGEFREIATLLLQLKESYQSEEFPVFKLSVDDLSAGGLLLSNKPDQKKRILEILQTHLESETQAGSYDKELEKNFQGGPDSDYVIDAMLLELFAFIHAFIGAELQIQSLSDDGDTITFTSEEATLLVKLSENLECLEESSEENLTIIIPKEKGGRYCFEASKFNEYFPYESFQKFQQSSETKIYKEMITEIDNFGNSEGNIPLRLTFLSRDGLVSRVAACYAGTNNEKTLLKIAQRLKNEGKGEHINILQTSKEVEFRISAPSKSGEANENITFHFNGKEAFHKILEKENPTANQEIQLSFGLRCLNGGFMVLKEPPFFQKDGSAEPISLTAPSNPEGMIESYSNRVSQILGSASLDIGKITCYPEYKTEEANAIISVPLAGEISNWRRMGLFLEVKTGSETILISNEEGRLLEEKRCFEAEIPLVENGRYHNKKELNEELEITVNADKNSDLPSRNTVQTVGPLSPWIKVGKTSLTEENFLIHYEARNWPNGKALKLNLEKKDQKSGIYRPLKTNATLDIEYFPPSSPMSENLAICCSPNQEGLTVQLSLNSIPGQGEYRYILNRPNNTLTPDNHWPVYDGQFVPVIGTFKADAFSMTFLPKGRSAVEYKNVVVAVTEHNMDEKSGECTIRYRYQNWPAEKLLRLRVYEIDPESQEKRPLNSVGDIPFGKAEGDGELTANFYQELLLPESEYLLSLELPENEELFPNVPFPPCEITVITGKLSIKAINYSKGEAAKKEGILKFVKTPGKFKFSG